MALSRIPPAELRWRLEPEKLRRADPGRPDEPVVERLVTRLEVALAGSSGNQCQIFVRGNPGTGRERILDRALTHVRPSGREALDCCYVHNFEQPDRPRLIRLPAGAGRRLASGLREISCFIRDELEGALQSRPIRNRLQALDDRSDAEMRRVTAPLEKKLKPHGLVLVREEVGQLVRLTVHVQQTGRVITQDDLANLVAKGQVSPEEFDQIRRIVRDSQQELREITDEINKIRKHAHQLGMRLLRAETRRLLANLAQPLLKKFDHEAVRSQVETVIADVLEKRVGQPTGHLADPELLYVANPIHSVGDEALPVVRESCPTPRNLIGTIDPAWLENRRSVASFRGIRGGSLLSADNGFLVVDAAALLAQPHSVALLVNTLSTRLLSIEPAPGGVASPAVSLRPDPIPIETRLVVIGTEHHWQRIRKEHPALAEMFGTPVDIPDSMPRDSAGMAWITAELERTVAEMDLPQPSDEALAALVEHAARMAGPGRLSGRIHHLADRLRHAAVIARRQQDSRISAVHVHQAIADTRPRRGLGSRPGNPANRFPVRQHQPGQAYVGCRITDGELSYGQLVRVQVGIAGSTRTRVDFDGLSQPPPRAAQTMLEALLARMLHIDQPLAIDAVAAFRAESGQEEIDYTPALLPGTLLAMISRLSDIPLRQDLLVLGHVDVEGRLGPVEAINEQIEDAFGIARERDDEINAGVIIPAGQRAALMLEPDVIQAARNDLFQIYAAGNLVQTLELLTGTSPGTWRGDRFQSGTLFDKARRRLLGEPVGQATGQTEMA